MNVVEIAALHLACLSWTGPYSRSHEIRELMKRFEQQREQTDGIEKGDLICPFHDRKTDFSYYVGAKIIDAERIPEDSPMMKVVIPSQLYLYHEHQGTTKDVEDTYRLMYEWISHSPYEKDQAALSVEVYRKQHDILTVVSDEVIFDIFIPLKFKK